ncbi:MAG TPA: YajQ family cyclic di-GMP-binding protein [Verrucomicrobiae bacterium]|nr:YajQ family cyclic di-GMP-binding protein [Verrucomicrobiae bacterium]
MPSFDVVSQVDKHQLANAIDQAQRELSNRYDLRGTNAAITSEKEFEIKVVAANEFQLKQVVDLLKPRLAARSIDLRALDIGAVETNLSEARQLVKIKQGIEQVNAKKVIAVIKESKLKVDASINGDKLRVTGKKRDDLQLVIALLKKSELPLPLQFENFRD